MYLGILDDWPSPDPGAIRQHPMPVTTFERQPKIVARYGDPPQCEHVGSPLSSCNGWSRFRKGDIDG
jgi:hypothetical protein